MDEAKDTNKKNTNQDNDSIAEQKAKYETLKEQERKRRFAILSGNIMPIQTLFHLKTGEYAYFQIETDRMAERDYNESHTSGKARDPFIKGGILRGNTQINTKLTQQRISKTEIIDCGTLLFTNIRMIFIGKEVKSISYNDLLSVEFYPNTRLNTTTLSAKYPEMLKNEVYNMSNNTDVELYYKGIMRLIGRDKSKITETDVKVDWPEFMVKKVSSSGKNKRWYESTKGTIALLIFFYPAGIFTMWKYMNWNPKLKVVITGIFALIFLFSLIGSSSNGNNNPQTNNVHMVTNQTIKIQKPTLAPTLTAKQQEDARVKNQAEAQAKTYKTNVMTMITQFETENNILNKHMPKSIYYDYKDDPIYKQLANAYANLVCLSPDERLSVDTWDTVTSSNVCKENEDNNFVNSYTEYNIILDDATGLINVAVNDLIDPEDNSQTYPHVAEVQIAIKRSERDIEMAKQTFNKYASSDDPEAVETGFDTDHFDGYDGEAELLNKLGKDVAGPDNSK